MTSAHRELRETNHGEHGEEKSYIETRLNKKSILPFGPSCKIVSFQRSYCVALVLNLVSANSFHNFARCSADRTELREFQ